MAIAAYAFLIGGAPKFAIVLLVIAWLIMSVSIYRHNFFEGKSKPAQVIGHILLPGLLAVVLIVLWFYLRPEISPPRHLTAKQHQYFVYRLKDFRRREMPKEWELRISCTVEAEEACAFAEELAQVFREAGWDVKRVGLSTPMLTTLASSPRGISIMQGQNPLEGNPDLPLGDLNPMARVLYDLLTGAGLKDVRPAWHGVFRNKNGTEFEYPENRVTIMVDLNP